MAQGMVSPESSPEMMLQEDSNPLRWIMQDLNWTFVEKVYCASMSEIVIIWTLFFIELFVICLALYGLCYLFKSDHAISTFVINLFITDIIQICVRPVLNFCTLNVIFYAFWIYIISILSNIGFMVCICLERYVMIKYPVWYRLHRSLRHSILLCLLVWAISCGFIGADLYLMLNGHLEYAFFISVFIFLTPYPLVIFCFVGSWRALSHSVSVTPEEQKKILRILALVLFSYTVLFLPNIVRNGILAVSIARGQKLNYDYLQVVSGIILYLNPFADSLLYVFLRQDNNSMLRYLCCKD